MKFQNNKIRNLLEKKPIQTSAPCRIDMGGTLDIKTFFYPLQNLFPSTVNIAINMRTRVKLKANNNDMIKVSSRGFKTAEYSLESAPFDHPLGLIFAIAAYFNAHGVHIKIDSSSPPRSALGGSSSAAVALVAAFSKAVEKITMKKSLSLKNISLLALSIEESVAMVPCGFQDHLAAAYGGVNEWTWQADIIKKSFIKKSLIRKQAFSNLSKHILLAYCGIPHASKDINSIWVKGFLSGKNRDIWFKTINYTKQFAQALTNKDYDKAARAMNKETALRRKMTPEVLNEIGEGLVDSAISENCGARFTGAGGGGCIWAIGRIKNIDRLKKKWQKILLLRNEARLLDAIIDSKGIVIENEAG